MSLRVLSDTDVRDLRIRRAQGETYEAISQSSGLPLERVWRLITGAARQAAGGPIAARVRPEKRKARPATPNLTGKRLSDQEVRELRELRAGGLSHDDLALRFGVSHWTAMDYATGKSRLDAGGPITKPGTVSTSFRKIPVEGETLTLKRAAEKVGVHPTILATRLKHGWDLDEVLNTPLIKFGPSQIDSEPGSPIAYVHLWGTDECAIVDADAVPKIAGRCWTKVVSAGRVYVVSRLFEDGKYAGADVLHRMLAPFEITCGVNVINGNGLDCRVANLEPESDEERIWKAGLYKNNSSGYRGVSWHCRRQEWYGQVCTDKKRYFLGRFRAAIEAALAVDAHLIKTRGAKARLNFPLPGYRGLRD